MKPSIAWWKIIVILVLLPCGYIAYSRSPWAIELFARSNNDYYVYFFGGLTFMHAVGFLLTRYLLHSSGWSDADIGFTITGGLRNRLLLGYFGLAVLLLGGVGYLEYSGALDPEKLSRIGDFFPKTNSQRILFVFTSLAAGFFEEYAFRGFGIRALESKGIPAWLGLILACAAFVFVHGWIAFSRFVPYFLMGLFFGVLYLWTKRLTLPIIVHCLIDLTAILMVLKASE